MSDVTVQANGVIFHPLEAIEKTGQTLRTFEDWIALSKYVNGLIQTGVINFDLISNETLFTVILTEASQEQVEALMKDWNFKIARASS